MLGQGGGADQASALLGAAKYDDYLGAYVIVSLTTGIRTEEARALRWDHVDLDGDGRPLQPETPAQSCRALRVGRFRVAGHGALADHPGENRLSAMPVVQHHSRHDRRAGVP